jgi:hypothetical protein
MGEGEEVQRKVGRLYKKRRIGRK